MAGSETPLRPVVEGDELVCPSCGEALNYSMKVDVVEHVNYEAEAVVRDGRIVCVGDGGQLSPEDAPALSETPRCGSCWQPLAFDEVSWE